MYIHVVQQHKRGKPDKKKMLDQALSDFEWRVSFQNAEAHALSAISSDYSSILLLLFPEHDALNKEFKLEAYWEEAEEYVRLLLKNGGIQISSRGQWQID